MDYGRYPALIKQYNETSALSIDPRETKESLIAKLTDVSRVKRQILSETNAIIQEHIAKYEKEPDLLDGEAAAMLEDFFSQFQTTVDIPDAPICLRISRLLLRYYRSRPEQDPEKIIGLMQQCAFYDVALKEHQNDYDSTPYAIMAEPYLAQVNTLPVNALRKLVNCMTIGGYNLKDPTFSLRVFTEHGDTFARILRRVGEDDFVLRVYFSIFKANSLQFALHGCFKTEEAKRRGAPYGKPLVDLQTYGPLMERFRDELAELLSSGQAQELYHDRVNLRINIALADFYLGKLSLDGLLKKLEEYSQPQEDCSPSERSSALLTAVPCYLDYLCVFGDHDRQYMQEKSTEIINHVLENTHSAVRELSEESRYSSESAVNNAVLQMLRTAAGFLDFDFFRRAALRTTVYANKELYVHTMMVKEIALTLLDYILDHEPEYLDGAAGMTWEYCRDHKKEVMELMENCALLHDIGKFYCLDIVNNSFRALTDDEFEIIREHPTNFSKIYQGAMDPKMACIRDCAELHHLWYNEQGGYPRRKHTANKPFVNILTIADCIDAATDNIGRPYGLDKTLEQVMAEFDAARCTRYSGHISDLLHVEEIRRRIEYIIRDGRQNFYCDIYLDHN